MIFIPIKWSCHKQTLISRLFSVNEDLCKREETVFSNAWYQVSIQTGQGIRWLHMPLRLQIACLEASDERPVRFLQASLFSLKRTTPIAVAIQYNDQSAFVFSIFPHRASNANRSRKALWLFLLKWGHRSNHLVAGPTRCVSAMWMDYDDSLCEFRQ